MTILARTITPPACMMHGCTETATVLLARRYMPGELVLARNSAGRYCYTHSIERLEYEVELEREQRETVAANIAAGVALNHGPTGMYGCKHAVCTLCGATYTRTDTPEGNRRFARVLDSHNDHAHPGQVIRYLYSGGT